jgi:hypothetical protein
VEVSILNCSRTVDDNPTASTTKVENLVQLITNVNSWRRVASRRELILKNRTLVTVLRFALDIGAMATIMPVRIIQPKFSISSWSNDGYPYDGTLWLFSKQSADPFALNRFHSKVWYIVSAPATASNAND